MLYDRWRETARQFADHVALTDFATGRRWTFRELAAEADKTSPDETRLAFPQGISPEFIFCVLRAWKRNAIVCPLENDQAPHVFSEFPSDCVHLKSTSATTGLPRWVAFTAAQLAADADNIVGTMGLRPDWPNLGLISLAHSYGFSNLISPLLLHGIPLILVHSPLPEIIKKAALSARDITLPAVPALWRTWFDTGAIPDNVRLAISAGAPLSLPLEKEIFRRWGVKVHNFYGATECGGIAFDRTMEPRQESTCVGAAMKNVGLSVTVEGCLQVESLAVGTCYWPRSSPALAGGRYVTSDLVRLENGRVFLLGRLSDEINVAGRKVSPEAVERVLSDHPEVAECLVFGAPSDDLDRTEMIVACVVSRSQPSAESLKQHLLKSLPAWQIPRDWWFVPSLEANHRGKLARGLWRQRYLKSKQTPL